MRSWRGASAASQPDTSPAAAASGKAPHARPGRHEQVDDVGHPEDRGMQERRRAGHPAGRVGRQHVQGGPRVDQHPGDLGVSVARRRHQRGLALVGLAIHGRTGVEQQPGQGSAARDVAPGPVAGVVPEHRHVAQGRDPAGVVAPAAHRLAGERGVVLEEPPEPLGVEAVEDVAAPALEDRRDRGLSHVPILGVVAQVAAEVRDGEGDPATLAGVDEPLLEQRVTRRGQRLRLLAEERPRRPRSAPRLVERSPRSASATAASAIARRYSRSPGVARSKRLPKNRRPARAPPRRRPPPRRPP